MVSEVKIAALALQAISNLSDCRQVAQVSKLIAQENFPGQFGYVMKKDLDIDLNTSLFLDMFEIGKRKYTQLRQHLENESNIREFMTDLINPDTDKMASECITLADNEHVQIDIVRSMFDGKMAGFLTGAGGASCQLCTATHNELKDREIIIQGFPINRYISDALEMSTQPNPTHATHPICL